MKIRAHHLLCMQGFQGYGYSPHFVENMTRVIEEINSSPTLELEIVAECDIICGECPHNQQGSCGKKSDSAERVRNFDLRVLQKLNLTEGMTVKANEIFAYVNDKLKNDSDLCGKCGWQEKCLWYASQNNIECHEQRI
ncbi:MAG: DUF1284 domain-containing protein [Phycisphaerae bacterium]